ncbi:MAG TPA: epoxide hydrolase [Acidimicrobiales bacterium]|nr:epoxide hydrolase [Acidimicrobiales bacterium]
MSDDGQKIHPFRLEVADDELEDLRRRLRSARWPEPATVDDWSQGVPLDYLRDIADHWAESYDWRRVESRLNDLGQYRTTIDGLSVHFIHARSPEPGALPLVLTHGWPGSVVEFLDAIGPLTDPVAHGGSPADAFHVVCPSVPGYGWSEKPSAPGWGVERIASAWVVLMNRLGYDRYGAQGGDWGSAVTTAIGSLDPDHCVGIHLNMPVAGPDRSELEQLSDDDKNALAAMEHYDRWDSGYSKQQSTRPQTIGYSLVDSPVGLLAWILEKFWAWTDCGGHPENAIGRDAILDNVMHYWLPATGASSARLYWESFRRGGTGAVVVPVGASRFPREIFRPARRWVERRYPTLRYWNELDSGGHFAAFEQPGLFVSELRAFFSLVR